MGPAHLTTLDIVALSIAVFLLLVLFQARKRSVTPPGPRPYPILGNLLDVPRKEAAWFVYERWAKQYGDIMSLSVLGQTLVIVNSFKIAKDLLDKRAAIYSDRPSIPMINLMHFNEANIALLRFGNEWRMTRRIADRSLRPSATVTYKPMQKRHAHRLVRQLLQTPDNYWDHIRHFTTAISMLVAYGYEIKDEGDHYVALAEEALLRGTASFYPGAWLVNLIPALNYLPEWLPGMGYRAYAKETAQMVYEMMNAPFDYVKQHMREGNALPSLSKENLEESQTPEDERLIKLVAASIYTAGGDTSGSIVTTILLVLTKFPEVQKRCQAELDSVVGRNRLPDWEDRDNLPYISAFCNELMRWRLASPMGTARRVMEDDVYEGYFIPKGTTVLINAWAILHDPATYPEPDVFKPERFLNEKGEVIEDPILSAQFGFGRRICPGRFLALQTLWITTVTVLSVFDVTPAKDKNGREIPVGSEYTNALVSQPCPFKCAITPRDDHSIQLIKETEKATY